jgi:hypothetical protein
MFVLFTLWYIVSLCNSLLLLSQNQAKSALVLKRILKQRPSDSQRLATSTVGGTGAAAAAAATTLSSDMSSHKERLRAAVRGAMGQRKEADMSDSVFLGRASTSASSTQAKPTTTERIESKTKPESSNPVDDM